MIYNYNLYDRIHASVQIQCHHAESLDVNKTLLTQKTLIPHTHRCYNL